ncbi:MAG: AGE family epimerase/isomerase [Saprospirales bacterium]|jgi:mannobiose 2-epimerase|nr:AGE family epimerase/isomerase [Saprospirales bacterium]MBK8921805.1 AGE family epimerase/isomerase [Saprospirales bacterium]
MIHKNILEAYRHDLQRELGHILDWWAEHMADPERGGFSGRIDNLNTPDPGAARGIVLHSRILWAFAAAARIQNDARRLATAQYAFDYLRRHFIDPEYGGVFWALTPEGQPLNTRKQIYGLAFAMYGLSEYFRASGQKPALDEAIGLFHWIEKYSYDAVRGGYLEAFACNGAPLSDLRLSPKDRNDPKTMNTHLHLLEAYANLYRVWPDTLLAQRLRHLIQLFLDHIINPLSGHLILFFDTGWAPQSDTISYGHDIEAAWLIQEAAGVLGDGPLLARCREYAVIGATAAARGLDETDGGLWYENQVFEKHWWAQAEAMVGFLNAWQISGEDHFLDKSIGCWQFVQRYLLDRAHGEWFWGIDSRHRVMAGEDKAGFWKCPYHNSRACLEIMERIPLSADAAAGG